MGTSRAHRVLCLVVACLIGAACDAAPPATELRGAIAPIPDTGGSLTLRVLDVTDSRIGGQAVLLTHERAGRSRHVLIDGGERPRTVASALRRAAVDSLALVVLTHAHSDHFGGLAEVFAEFPVLAFAWNGDARALASYRRLLRRIDSSGATPLLVGQEAREVTLVTAGDSARLELLPPLSGRAVPRGDSINNRSVGVLARYGEFSALIPGDAEHAQQRSWSRRYGDRLDVDVLVSSHHGSRDANSTVRSTFWYTIVTPEVLLISANGRQHPFAEVLDYVRGLGIPVWCTSSHGTIAVRGYRDGTWRVASERQGACRPGTERPVVPRRRSGRPEPVGRAR